MRRRTAILCFITSGSGAGLRNCDPYLAGDEAKIIEMSWYGDGDISAAARRRVSQPPVDNHLQSRSGRSCTVSSPTLALCAPALAAALDLLGDDRLDALIAPPIAFTDLPAHLPRIFGAPGQRRTLPAYRLSVRGIRVHPLKSATTIMIAHSFRGAGVWPGARRCTAQRSLSMLRSLRKTSTTTASWRTSAAPMTFLKA